MIETCILIETYIPCIPIETYIPYINDRDDVTSMYGHMCVCVCDIYVWSYHVSYM